MVLSPDGLFDHRCMLSVPILTRNTRSSALTHHRNSRPSRTDRPELLPTVAEVLALPVVAAGGPQVLAGAASLGSAVRWVHVVEAQDVTELLDGHELLLATGVGWPDGDGWIPGYIAELAAAKVAGLVLELGTRYGEAPGALVDCCRSQRLPLVVLESAGEVCLRDRSRSWPDHCRADGCPEGAR